jgi:hypothetical protein
VSLGLRCSALWCNAPDAKASLPELRGSTAQLLICLVVQTCTD